MKVIFDHQIFSIQKYGGISRYFYNLYLESLKQSEIEIEIDALYSQNEYFSRKNSFIDFLIKLYPEKQLSLILHINKLYGSRPRPFSLEKTIIHQTYYQEKRTDKFPHVITAYDLTHEKFPQYFPNQEKFLTQKRQALTSADLILSISENTKMDLINFYNIAAEKIVVTHLADSLWVKDPRFETNLKLPEHYVLFVGNREGYKNYFNTIEILADSLKKNQITFLCAGGPKFTEEEKTQIKKHGLINLVKHYPFRTDDELRTFYKNAMFFIFPSLYEGFGIPVLESMGCGTPVLLTRGSSFSEVGGEAGVYYDHSDANDLMTQFNKLLSPENLKEVKARSLLNYKKFSWAKCFSETKLAYSKFS